MLAALIACGLTQVVAALSLRPSAFGLGACAFAWVHQLLRPGWTRAAEWLMVNTYLESNKDADNIYLYFLLPD